MDPFESYLTKALQFLKVRPRSEQEVRENLKKKRADEATVEKILLFLRKKKFVNDEAFAKWWVRQRVVFRPKSTRIIRLELIKKGIAKEYITEALTEEVEDGGKLNDLEQAKKILEKKAAKYQHLDKQERYQKLGSFLARRGFDWDTIKRSIDAVFE